MRVEWCVRNERTGVRRTIECWVKHPAVHPDSDNTRRYACLDVCDTCARQPFVLVDNQLVSADSADTLLRRLTDMKQGETL